METMKCFFLFAFFLSMISALEIEAKGCENKGTHKLFVFGDSYADTGNLIKWANITRCWYEPYGMSLPIRRPSGRFSDGKILTDYIASFLGIKSPIPYKYRRVGSKLNFSGMNFAVGGTGVFDTGNFQRSLSAQVDTFEAQINEAVFSSCDAQSSIALVSISGNDYMEFFDQRNVTDMKPFINKVTTQIKLELERIKKLGVGKVVVTNLNPVYCTPYATRDENYKRCSDRRQADVRYHNDELEKRVRELNGGVSTVNFFILDLYTPFLTIFKQEKKTSDQLKNIFKPCCEGIDKGANCGQKDDKGLKLYSLCPNPQDYFYWDSVHPSQAGWAAVFQLIRPWLRRHLL